MTMKPGPRVRTAAPSPMMAGLVIPAPQHRVNAPMTAMPIAVTFRRSDSDQRLAVAKQTSPGDMARLGRFDPRREVPLGCGRDRTSWRGSERTLVLVKPDAVRRGLVGEVVRRFERKGLRIEAMVLRSMNVELADRHYAEHLDKPFYPPLRDFMTSGPLVAMVLAGDQAVEVTRLLTGMTDGRKAAPGTIRGDLALSNRENLVHASDSADSAKREIALWFPELT